MYAIKFPGYWRSGLPAGRATDAYLEMLAPGATRWTRAEDPSTRYAQKFATQEEAEATALVIAARYPWSISKLVVVEVEVCSYVGCVLEREEGSIECGRHGEV